MANEDFYPESKPYNTGYLPVGDGHELYYEEFGNPDGEPIVFLHGGPGGGHASWYHRYFDPTHFRVIIYDQRGAGQSRPFGDISNNSPDHLVADNETLREHLGIDKWHVFGGSWGSTLALLYAEAHPDRVKSLTLRGIFMMREKELHDFYESNAIFPDEFAKLKALIPPEEQNDLISAFFRRVCGDDAAQAEFYARAWSTYEGAVSRLIPPTAEELAGDDPVHLIGMAKMETHFFHNHRFQPDDRILKNLQAIRGAKIPVKIVQGRYDAVCPISSALDLAAAMPEADIEITISGHSAKDPATVSALVRATDNIRDTGSPLGKKPAAPRPPGPAL